MPVRSGAAEREDWSLHSETLLTGGPYRATGWDETGLTAQAADGYYDARRLGAGRAGVPVRDGRPGPGGPAVRRRRGLCHEPAGGRHLRSLSPDHPCCC